MAEHVTGISLRDVRRLLDDKSPGEKAFEALDALIGAAIALSPAALGPGGMALWALLEPKNALVDALKQAVKLFTRARPSDYVEQAGNLAAANCILTYTAFFDALTQRLPELVRDVRLTEAKRASVAAPVAGAPAGGDPARWLVSIPQPGASTRFSAAQRRPLYLSLSVHLRDYVSGTDMWRQQPKAWHESVAEVLQNELPDLAESMYQAEFLGLAAESPAFFICQLGVPRRALVLLARWARETDDPAFARELFGRFKPTASLHSHTVPSGASLGKIDVDKLALSLDLSYREAADLRWVVDTLRAGPPAGRRSARKGSVLRPPVPNRAKPGRFPGPG